ncbi:hypothetical protein SLE2022_287860 [Rubroshorea leprosula]
MRQKYLRFSKFLTTELGSGASASWRSILKCRDVLQIGLQWRVGLGNSINFWKDQWTSSSPLSKFIVGPVFSESLTMPVSSVITNSMNWNQELLATFLPEAQVKEILSIPLSSTGCIQDKIVWRFSDDGFFSVKSAFHQILLQKEPIPLQDQCWKWVWKLRCSERVRMFVWLLLRNRVLTNAVRYERHLAASSTCPRCGGESETALHLLRDCPFAIQVWTMLGLGNHVFFQLSWQQWIRCGSQKVSKVCTRDMSYDVLFLSAVWELWKCRNRLVFKGEHLPAATLCDAICAYAQDTYRAMACNIFVKSQAPRWISWQPPVPPFYKLNTDGSRLQETGLASAGGVVRDHLGAFIQGFSMNIGLGSISLAELWGCREGLILCRSRGLKHLVVEMDSSSAVQVINGLKKHDSLAVVLVSDIRRLRVEFDSIIFQHTLREGNPTADFLLELGITYRLERWSMILRLLD